MLKIALMDYFKEHVGCLERMVAAYVIGFSVTVDFVLPCTTEWETPGGFPNANRETLIMYRQVVEPFYEARPDSKITGACMRKEPLRSIASEAKRLAHLPMLHQNSDRHKAVFLTAGRRNCP